MNPYNPLDKVNLGRSVAEALLDRPLESLSTLSSRGSFVGAGVYAIYYLGIKSPYASYKRLAEHNSRSDDLIPIYVGKAIPPGARTAGVGLDAPAGTVLYKRLREHAESIRQADNLDLEDFMCRYLLVDDIWIPLGESLLIQSFKPIWNVLVDGFGNHDPGAGRRNQRRSPWDTIHPGRPWASLMPRENDKTPDQINQLIEELLTGEDVPIKSTFEAIEAEDT